MPLISNDHFPLIRIVLETLKFSLKVKVFILDLILVRVRQEVACPEFGLHFLDRELKEARIV
jgi:hypothetical protein